MNSMPTLERGRQQYLEWIIAASILWLLVVLLFGPLTATGGLVLERRTPVLQERMGWLAISLVWGLVLLWQFSHSGLVWWQYWGFLSLPLVVVACALIRVVKMASRFLKPKTLQELVDEQAHEIARRTQIQGQRASGRNEVDAPEGWLGLGPKLKGDLLPDYLGIRYISEWTALHEQVLDQHLFLLGATGAGKSETIKRLVLEILSQTDRDIFFVDGKGDEQLANDIRSLIFHHRGVVAPVFRLGFDRLGAIYDGFRGQAPDVYNRLCALVGVAEAEGDAAYYADINRDLLQLICYAPGGPPRNFEQVRQRLDRTWLLQVYRDNPIERETIDEEIDKKDLQSLARRIRPLEREFRPCVGDDGFALEETSFAIFSIRAQSVSDTARRFLDFLVEDLKDFVGKRQRRPGVLIIDEFGQFSNNNIISLLTLARSSKLGVVLATQDTASLKDEPTKKLVLANTRTKILMATDFPEEVAELAGTIYRAESSMQHEDGETTGKGSVRVQHGFKIDMNEAAKLKPGEAFVLRQRHAIKVHIRQTGEVEQIAPQEPEQRRVIKQPPSAKKVAKRL